MKLSRARRLVAALITLFSLLFTQLAVAAYDCPDLRAKPASMPVLDMAGGMPACPGLDQTDPGLCKAHCDSDSQALDAPTALHVPPFVAVTLAGVAVEVRAVPAAHMAAMDFSLQAATVPPIAIRHCCFRI